MRPATALTSLVALLGAASVALADGRVPDRSYSQDQLYRVISPSMGRADHNQSSVVGGYLLLAGNARHALWDISDPFAPALVSEFRSEHGDGEAESHQVALARRGDRLLVATTSGIGVDLWDLSDARSPRLLSAVRLPGVNYGDNTEAVWGIAWQGDALYVGGTNTGLHVVDTSDLDAPRVVQTLPISEFGGVSAGPLWALGNLLVITTPKSHAGVATLDISDPWAPSVLDFERPEVDSYIGGFYGGNAYLLAPVRTYDVTSDPAEITLLGAFATPPSEYLSFGDGFLFLGGLRPDPGVRKIRIGAPDVFDLVGMVRGRRDDPFNGSFTDDQFPLPIGNLLVLSDDEIDIGSALAVHDTRRDTTPPEVLYVNPPDGATGQAPTTRVGLSFSDQIDIRSLDASAIALRPLGGEPVPGTWGLTQTVANFWPDEPLLANTTYEIVLAAGGVTDLVGNGLAAEFRSTFSTGESVVALPCAVTAAPVALGGTIVLQAEDAGAGAVYSWRVGSPAVTASGRRAELSADRVGRHVVSLDVERDGLRRSCTALQVVHRPLAEPGSSSSATLVAQLRDEGPSRVWAVNRDAASVAVLEGGAVAAEIGLDGRPSSVAWLAPSIWVAMPELDTLVAIDPETTDVVREVTLPWGHAPSGIAVDALGEELWVTLEHAGAVAVIDAATGTQTDTVVLPAEAGAAPRVRGIAFGADGHVYVSRFVSADHAGEVYVIDAATREVVDTIALAVDPGPDTNLSGRGLPNYLGAPTISPDGTTAWITAKKDNIERGPSRDGESMTTMNTVRTMVTSLDLAQRVEREGSRVDLDDHNMAVAVALSPVGDLAFVLSMGTNQVDVLDAYDGTRVAGASTDLGATGLALFGTELYVNNEASNTVTVYDASRVLSGSGAVLPRLRTLTTVAEDPFTPQIRLGRQLFVNADSRQLSQDGYISCFTCHADGGDDGRTWDFGDRGEGLRNTTDLRGRAGTAHGPVHWTGNFDEIQDFEHDIRAHFGGTGLMADADFESGGRDQPLGAPKAGVSEALDALAAYVATFGEFPRSPHRNADGTPTDEAVLGHAIFVALDCLDCHSGQALTDSALDVRHDVGTWRESSGGRLGGAPDGFDTPTLRGLWASPPYLHDGSAATVEDALRVPGHGNAVALGDAHMAALVAFLLQLEGETLDLERRPFDFGAGDADDAGADVGADAAPDAAVDATPEAGTDAGRSSRGGRGGCASAPGTFGGGLAWLLIAVGALGARSRRRR